MPADFALDLSPLDGFVANILDPAVHARMVATGAAMVESARQGCPPGDETLRASIGSAYDPATRELTVYSTAPWALAVELGWPRKTANGRTMDFAARPFLRGSLAAVPGVWGG